MTAVKKIIFLSKAPEASWPLLHSEQLSFSNKSIDLYATTDEINKICAVEAANAVVVFQTTPLNVLDRQAMRVWGEVCKQWQMTFVLYLGLEAKWELFELRATYHADIVLPSDQFDLHSLASILDTKTIIERDDPLQDFTTILEFRKDLLSLEQAFLAKENHLFLWGAQKSGKHTMLKAVCAKYSPTKKLVAVDLKTTKIEDWSHYCYNVDNDHFYYLKNIGQSERSNQDSLLEFLHANPSTKFIFVDSFSPSVLEDRKTLPPQLSRRFVRRAFRFWSLEERLQENDEEILHLIEKLKQKGKFGSDLIEKTLIFESEVLALLRTHYWEENITGLIKAVGAMVFEAVNDYQQTYSNKFTDPISIGKRCVPDWVRARIPVVKVLFVYVESVSSPSRSHYEQIIKHLASYRKANLQRVAFTDVNDVGAGKMIKSRQRAMAAEADVLVALLCVSAFSDDDFNELFLTLDFTKVDFVPIIIQDFDRSGLNVGIANQSLDSFMLLPKGEGREVLILGQQPAKQLDTINKELALTIQKVIEEKRLS